MRVLLDSSVLIAALVLDHEQNQASYALVLAAAHRGVDAIASTHAWAETYSQFTGHPLFRVAPADVNKAISATMRYVSTVELGVADYTRAFEKAAHLAVTGGGFFDLLHIQAGEKASADAVATWNLSDFRRVHPEGVMKVLTPAEVLELI